MMDHSRNHSHQQSRSAAHKWESGRPPPPPLAMQEGLPSTSSSHGREFRLEDRPKVNAFLSLGIRFLQALVSLVSFCLMAASNQSFSYHTGFTKVSLELHYSDFPPFSFLVAAMVLAWLWSMGIMIVDLLELLCGWRRLRLERWRIWTCFLTDTILLLLSFGAACTAAGVTTINGLLCDSQIDNKFCRQAKVAAGFAFAAWAAFVPSFVSSLMCVFRDYN